VIENVPAYVSLTFIATTFVTAGIFLRGIQGLPHASNAGKILLFIIPFWMMFQAILAISGFYLNTDTIPPRIFLFGPLPAVVLIAIYFISARTTVVENLPLKLLTVIHTIRIPVELVLAWLFAAGLVPEVMTFHGSNFDIVSGITAPIIAYYAFRKDRVNTKLLVVWNIICLLLLFKIVITAVLCVPSPIQKLAFDQPNIAILYFPYIWLPTVVVPIVLFCHLASFWKIFRGKVI
jgi:hypothetical protein